jgi:uncharacterized membrane protein YedE/YeeE
MSLRAPEAPFLRPRIRRGRVCCFVLFVCVFVFVGVVLFMVLSFCFVCVFFCFLFDWARAHRHYINFTISVPLLGAHYQRGKKRGLRGPEAPLHKENCNAAPLLDSDLSGVR